MLHNRADGRVIGTRPLSGPAVRVSNEGTVLTMTGQLVKQGETAAWAVDMDDQARFVVFQTRSRRRICVTDSATNRQ
jgi:hypothetical protein